MSTSNKVPRNMFYANVISYHKEIELRITEFLRNVESLEKRKDNLGLNYSYFRKPVPKNRAVPLACTPYVLGRKKKNLDILIAKFPSTPLVDETQVYGRDGYKEAILMKLLITDDVNDNCYSVIPILAMGGMGKTTLAQLVYNDDRVTDQFDIKLWIYLSKQSHVNVPTKSILDQLNVPADVSEDLSELQLKITDRLSRKKFLLAVDDFWNDKLDRWEHLQRPFNNGTVGSKILVTTQIENVTKVMQSVSIHRLKQLEILYKKCI
ncbi:Disease resistance protein [Quillaja saponaria]|uniref:Disease resistance protein n=1 Tax=Quillaja saponaria TaxID=32244 RepID=A0AAD7L0L7_QUISA|nr:Disease resistance protein [Quillaja saponaria]